MCRCIRGFVFAKVRIYAGSVKKKRICNLGFAEVCGMKCLICSAVLLLSVNDVFYSSGLSELISFSLMYD